MAKDKKPGVNFDDILDKSVDDIESPQPVPAGTYLARIAGPPTGDTFKGKDEKTGEEVLIPVYDIPIALLEPTDGVDLELLEKAGGLQRRDGKPKELKARYYAREDELHKVKKLLKSCGITGTTLREGFLQLPGCEVLVDVATIQSKNDSEEWFNRINRVVGTAAAAAA